MAQETTATGGVTNATLYLHFPCFDGVASAVVAAEFLEQAMGWHIEAFVPVNYDRLKTWREEKIPRNSAVVDFLYHPRVRFWADHHQTSFVNPRDREALLRPSRRLLYYNPECTSCALLLWRELGDKIPFPPHFAELVLWADKIDSANYESVDEAIFGNSPATDINLSFSLERDSDYCCWLIENLRIHDLETVADYSRVRVAAEAAKEKMRIGLNELASHIDLKHGVAVGSVSPSEGSIVNRYSPYYFFPEARYSILMTQSSDRALITAMRNPWRDFESVELGKIFERFGGGGHRRVASIFLPKERLPEASSIAGEIVDAIRIADTARAAVG